MSWWWVFSARTTIRVNSLPSVCGGVSRWSGTRDGHHRVGTGADPAATRRPVGPGDFASPILIPRSGRGGLRFACSFVGVRCSVCVGVVVVRVGCASVRCAGGKGYVGAGEGIPSDGGVVVVSIRVSQSEKYLFGEGSGNLSQRG